MQVHYLCLDRKFSVWCLLPMLGTSVNIWHPSASLFTDYLQELVLSKVDCFLGTFQGCQVGFSLMLVVFQSNAAAFLRMKIGGETL